jgi:hypothetical protein
MEASMKSNVSQATMLALTKAYNAYIIFKKCQVDVAILIDPTHTREEFEESITTKMDLHLSHNAVSNVLLPAAFIAQDYSAQITELRDKRKADSLVKPSRKAKRAADDSDAEESEGLVKVTPGGKKFIVRKGKGAAKPSTNDGSDSDNEPIQAKKKKRRVVHSEPEEEVQMSDANAVESEKGPLEHGNSSSDDSEEEAEIAKSSGEKNPIS